jgi:putative ATP-binding cassette transporter
VTLRLADGGAITTVPDFELAPAQRLQLSGASGAGKSSLFKALAGIWPMGQGKIDLPHGARVLALPQRPYFPLGTLRQALTYPALADTVDEATVRAAMADAGLSHLLGRLDEESEWNTVLSGGEQQRVGFARALIHRPTILLLDEAVSTLESAQARELYRMLSEKLPDTVVISIDRAAALAGLHHRTIEITSAPASGRAATLPSLMPVPA